MENTEPLFAIRMRALHSHGCEYEFALRGENNGKQLLSGSMTYEHNDCSSTVRNDYQFVAGFGNDNLLFRQALRYLAMLEEEFKMRLDKKFVAPKRNGPCAKRPRVCAAAL
jgi:hypothetical protein